MPQQRRGDPVSASTSTAPKFSRWGYPCVECLGMTRTKAGLLRHAKAKHPGEITRIALAGTAGYFALNAMERSEWIPTDVLCLLYATTRAVATERSQDPTTLWSPWLDWFAVSDRVSLMWAELSCQGLIETRPDGGYLITLDNCLGRRGWSAVLAHEMIHFERQELFPDTYRLFPRHADPRYVAEEELLVNAETARRFGWVVVPFNALPADSRWCPAAPSQVRVEIRGTGAADR